MKKKIDHFLYELSRSEALVQNVLKPMRDHLDVQAFAYVRVYNDDRLSWVTSDADHDRFLVEHGFLAEDPLLDGATMLGQGSYIWTHNRAFQGSETFYAIREKEFGLDHGLVLVRHQKEYLETVSFSGLMKKKCLFSRFMNEKKLFETFFDFFTKKHAYRLEEQLQNAIPLSEVKTAHAKVESKMCKRAYDALASFFGHEQVAHLTKRQKEVLVLFAKGYSYNEISLKLQLSPRTVEHYLEAAKSRVGITTKSTLRQVAKILTMYDSKQ